jgi:hypothetical protein
VRYHGPVLCMYEVCTQMAEVVVLAGKTRLDGRSGGCAAVKASSSFQSWRCNDGVCGGFARAQARLLLNELLDPAGVDCGATETPPQEVVPRPDLIHNSLQETSQAWRESERARAGCSGWQWIEMIAVRDMSRQARDALVAPGSIRKVPRCIAVSNWRSAPPRRPF